MVSNGRHFFFTKKQHGDFPFGKCEGKCAINAQICYWYDI